MSKGGRLGSIRTPRPAFETEVQAVGAVLHRALDAADAAELLAMLGLIGASDRSEQDQLCPSRAAHQRLAERRSARLLGPVSERRNLGG